MPNVIEIKTQNIVATQHARIMQKDTNSHSQINDFGKKDSVAGICKIFLCSALGEVSSGSDTPLQNTDLFSLKVRQGQFTTESLTGSMGYLTLQILKPEPQSFSSL